MARAAAGLPVFDKMALNRHLPADDVTRLGVSCDEAQRVRAPRAVIAPSIKQLPAHLDEFGTLVSPYDLIGHDVRQSSLANSLRNRWHLLRSPSAERRPTTMYRLTTTGLAHG